MPFKFILTLLLACSLLSCKPSSRPPETKQASSPEAPSSVKTNPQKWLASPKPLITPSPSVIFLKRRTQVLKTKKKEAWTGLIIDARGFGVKPSHTAEIYDLNGHLIYPANYDPQVLVEQGLVAYAYQLNVAKNHPRAGKHPLIVKVLKAKPPASVVLSKIDSQSLRGLSQVLRTYQVVFLVDP